jgi:ectoine hydroxylase-related dioxygenase (phytanoyl-CoA dioxygenase family)
MRLKLFILFFIAIDAWSSEWDEQRAFFDRHGYVVLKNFYSESQVYLLKEWADEIDRESRLLLEFSEKSNCTLQELAYLLPQTLIVVPEVNNPKQVCRAEDMLTCYPELCALIKGSIVPYISAFMKEPYLLFKDKLNFKWPGGGAFLPHQDFPAYDFFGPQIHITAMITIDPSTIENGCLQVAEDWKTAFANDLEIDEGQLENGRAVLPYVKGGRDHGSIQKKFSERISWVPLECESGDVILISSFIPHYSEPNRSLNPRRAMLFTLNRQAEGDHRNTYYQKKRGDFDNPAFHFATPTHARSKE